MTTRATSVALTFDGASRSFGSGERRVEALAGISLRFAPGRLVGLVGRNGAGKTTLLRLASGLLAPTGGRVLVLGRDLAREPGVARAVGSLGADERSFPPRLTALEGLCLYAALRGIDRREARERARRRAAELEAVELLDRPYQELSSGQRQRIALVRALLHDPPVLLLDEPTHALDAGAARAVFELARREAERGALVIASSHDLAGVEEWCDELVVLERGRVVVHGERESVLPALAARGWRVRFTSVAARDAAIGRHARLRSAPDARTALLDDDVAAGLPREIDELARSQESGLVALERRERASLDELLAEIGAGRMPALSVRESTGGECSVGVRHAPAALPRRGRRVGRALLALVRRDMKVDLSYRFKLVLQAVLLALWAAMFGFLAQIIDGGEPELRGEPLGFLLIGLAALELSQVAMTHMANALREEQLQGTLEPLLATGRSPLLIVLGSVVWRVTVVAVMATLVLGAGMAALGALAPNANVVGALAVFALGIAAWVALGLMSAGFVHAFKRGDPIALAFNVASLVTAGAYFPRALLPSLVQDLTAVLPHTTMLWAARAALLSGSGFGDADFREPFVRLVVSVLVLAPLAVLVWRAAHRRARERGTIANA